MNVTRTKTVYLGPWWIFLVVAGLILAFFVWRYWRRRRGARGEGEPAKPPTPEPAEPVAV